MSLTWATLTKFDSHLNQMLANREVDHANSCKLPAAKQSREKITNFSYRIMVGRLNVYFYTIHHFGKSHQKF